MKKIFLFILTVCLLLTACSGNSTDSGNKTVVSVTTGDKQTAEGKKTVVIAVMNSDRVLEMAAQKFEELHPNIHIEIKEYKASELGNGASSAISQADMEKYVQSVMTQVNSGKGTDLILMNNLPQDKFVAKNLLVNLYDLMKKDSSFDKSNLYEGILKASQDGEGLYAIPLAFSLELMEGNTKLLKEANITLDKDTPWTWDKVKEIGKKLKEKDYIVSQIPPDVLLYDFIESEYSRLVQQGKANFDSDFFRGIMAEVKSMFDEGILSKDFTSDNSKSVFLTTSVSLPKQALMGRSNMELFQKPSASKDTAGVSFTSYFSFGLNSKSSVQQEAWEFIKYLFSDEVQSNEGLAGLPMNKNVVAKKFDQAIQQLKDGKLDIPQTLLPDVETAKTRLDAIKKFMTEANVRRSSDMKVISIAMEEFSAYMSGQKSAADVSKLIQNRVTTYLNE